MTLSPTLLFSTKKIRCFCLSVAMFTLSILGNAQPPNTAETAIRKVLALQVAAWNDGNIEEFMKGYWRNDSLAFIGKNGLTYGYDNTLQNYKKSYPDKSAMGTLHFDLLQLKSLSNQYFFVAGKWHLQRSAGDVGGHFTLLFRKISGVWKIISDHSS